MPELAELLAIAQRTACEAGKKLLTLTQEQRRCSYADGDSREVKSVADRILEEKILQVLAPLGLPILSEESGYLGVDAGAQDDRWFIVDPLDGTFNFVRGLGPCSVSIALWQDERPLFGVIYEVTTGQLAWGGAEHGAFLDGAPLKVSSITELRRACLCTGFPASLDLSSEETRRQFWRRVALFGKVRMLGAATVSLLQVARGAADAYWESEIRLWDVAAGLAIVEGAGGRVGMREGADRWARTVFATNAGLSSALT